MFSLSQKDPRWANVRLGASRMTVGGWGCTTTCESILSYYAHQFIDPGEFARQKENYTGVDYARGPGLVLWTEFSKDLDNVKYQRRFYGHDAELVAEALKRKDRFPILQVATGIAKYPEHWVVPIRALKGGDYLIMDPIDGKERKLLSKYVGVTGGVIAEAVEGFEFSDPAEVEPPQLMPVKGLIKAQTSEKIYFYSGSFKYHVPDEKTWEVLFNREEPQVLTDAITMAIPEGEPMTKMQ